MEELKLKTDKTPTIFNRDMFLYAAVAPLLIVPGANLLVTGAAAYASFVALGSMVVGGLVGGAVGKKTIEKSNTEGVDAPSPSFFNKRMVIGTLLPSVTSLTALGVAQAVGKFTLAGLSGAWAPVVMFALGASTLTTMLTGAYIAGTNGKKEMAANFEKAKQQYIVNEISANVSPEVGQAVAYSMEHNKDWAKNVLEEKLMKTGQQPGMQP